MEKDYYESIEDFIAEYGNDISSNFEKLHGLDFRFKGKLYRMSKDQMESTQERLEFEKKINRKLGPYEVALVNEDILEEQYNQFMKKLDYVPYAKSPYTFIGWYNDIHDLLENCYIEGIKFKEIILDQNTVIEGQD